MFRKTVTFQKSAVAGQRRVVATISNESVDRQGDIVIQAGLSTRNFMRTGGTVLWSHDADSPIAKCVAIRRDGAATTATAQFPPAGVSPTADEIYGLIKEGVVNSTSIGFSVVESEPIDPKAPWKGKRFTKAELCEFSFVSVPANAGALIIERSAAQAASRQVGSIAALDQVDVGRAAPQPEPEPNYRALGGAYLTEWVRREEQKRLRRMWS